MTAAEWSESADAFMTASFADDHPTASGVGACFHSSVGYTEACVEGTSDEPAPPPRPAHAARQPVPRRMSRRPILWKAMILSTLSPLPPSFRAGLWWLG